ncbi:MAG TPA: hypothetical protein EYP73_05925 [Acidimicrobiia bacterium]|nr:hypothetical protein [Acidimicrobiia bacterium]
MLIPVRGEKILRRIAQLVVGLVAFGTGIGLMLRSELGLAPWDVLHQGLARRTGLTVGTWSILVSVAVLFLWLPLRERFGLAALVNAVTVGVTIDVTAALVTPARSWGTATAMLAGGILLTGVGSGLYIGANLGSGPRDGLMTAIARRGPSLRTTRTVLEISVLAAGWLLGGTVGVGTLAFAALIGPLVHLFLPIWTIDTGYPEDSWDHPRRHPTETL